MPVLYSHSGKNASVKKIKNGGNPIFFGENISCQKNFSCYNICRQTQKQVKGGTAETAFRSVRIRTVFRWESGGEAVRNQRENIFGARISLCHAQTAGGMARNFRRCLLFIPFFLLSENHDGGAGQARVHRLLM